MSGMALATGNRNSFVEILFKNKPSGIFLGFAAEQRRLVACGANHRSTVNDSSETPNGVKYQRQGAMQN
jgi:hypothetical protein